MRCELNRYQAAAARRVTSVTVRLGARTSLSRELDRWRMRIVQPARARRVAE